MHRHAALFRPNPDAGPGGLSVRVACWRWALRDAHVACRPHPLVPRRPQVALSGSRRSLRCPGVRSFRAPPPAAGRTRVLVLAIPEISHCWSRHICARRVRVSVVATRSAMRGRHELARAVDDRATASPWAGCTWGLKDGVVGRAAYAASRYHRRNRAVPVVVLPLE